MLLSGYNMELPQKRYYRQRAHSNPLADHCFEYPVSPNEMDWREVFPAWEDGNRVEFLDVGCGYGGLLTSLSPLYPGTHMLGLEIRVKVSDYVKDRIKALQLSHAPGYTNIGVLRTNAMKHLPNYFRKGQITKLFCLFPDPHFKKTKHKWRIINRSLLAEYAYIMQEGSGLMYLATDVQDLHQWMKEHLEAFPLFEEVCEVEKQNDPIIPLLSTSTEEGKKVARAGGVVYTSCFRRVSDPKAT